MYGAKVSGPVVLVLQLFWHFKTLYFGFPETSALTLKHVGILYIMYDF
jgi:hypothetical protein